jgi:hypothetical protein
VSIDPQNNRLSFGEKLPLVSVYVPTDPKYLVRADLTKSNSPKTLFSQTFLPAEDDSSYPFLKLNPTGRVEKRFTFTEADDYTLQFLVRDPRSSRWFPITRLRFTVEFLSVPSMPKPVALLSEPWGNWAYLWFPYEKRATGRPEVRLWRRGDKLTKAGGDEYTIQVIQDQEVVGVSQPQSVADFEQTRLRFPLSLAQHKGGGPLQAKDLLAGIGQYHILVQKNGRLDSAYPFVVVHDAQNPLVKEPPFKFHARQTPIYSISGLLTNLDDLIVPRMPSDKVERHDAGETVWMERIANSEADALFKSINRKPATPMPQLPIPMMVTESPAIPQENPTPPQVASTSNAENPTKPPKLEPKPPETASEPDPVETRPVVPEVAATVPEAHPMPTPAELETDARTPIEPPGVFQAHLPLILIVLLAHVGIGVFCSYKILVTRSVSDA